MIHALIGSKVKQTQAFDQKGMRTPATVISAGPCWVTQIKTNDTDGYTAVQLGFETKRHSSLSKPLAGHVKKAGLEKQAPRFFREIRIDEPVVADKKINQGDTITVEQVFQAGDVVQITGTSKGKGFTGVVKRWGFRGGPKTHGQSDRLRAPGSIGSTTTPGRVYRGKRMAGRSGSDTVTVKNLEVISVDSKKNELMVSGLIPGPRKGLVTITVTKRVEKPQEKTIEAKEMSEVRDQMSEQKEEITETKKE